MQGTCHLCGQEDELLQSHLMPKFAVRALKKTSATGKFRQPTQVKLRLQDADKPHLFCATCEQRFSKWEKQFAERILQPLMEGHAGPFEYEDWLPAFAASLAFRTILVDKEHSIAAQPQHGPLIRNAYDVLRRELCTDNPRPVFRQAVFLPQVVHRVGKYLKLPTRFNWYTQRTLDMSLAVGPELVVAYTQLPGVQFFTFLYPSIWSGLETIQVSNSGVLRRENDHSNPDLAKFIIGRAALVQSKLDEMPSHHWDAIGKQYLAVDDDWLSGHAFRAAHADYAASAERAAGKRSTRRRR